MKGGEWGVFFKFPYGNLKKTNSKKTMTLEGWVKKQLERRYPTCWTFECPKDANFVSVDFMQFVKSTLPDYIKTQKQMVRYFINKIIKFTDLSDIVIINFDKGSPEVKKMVCHVDRHDKRCKKCKTVTEFHPECDMGCRLNQPLKHEDGPHLDINEDAPISFAGNDWMKFALDSRNLHYELYPRLANAMIDLKLPRGKMIFFTGLPFLTKEVFEVDEQYQHGFLFNNKRSILTHWTESSMANKSLYDFNRVFVFEGEGFPRECPEMHNTIHEADNSIFFFSHFFPDRYRHLHFINDGDAISIGLFRAIENLIAPEHTKHEHWICLPYRNKKEKAMMAKPPPFQYLNITKMLQKIDETPEFIQAGIQSHAATIVFLIILSGTDFFNKADFCAGIGGEVIWDVFYGNLPIFSHLVQYYPNVKDPTVERRVVIDEDLFKIFVQKCFIHKYAEACKKKFRLEEDEPDYKMIELHCSKLKKGTPKEETILLWCRQITWNINYWANAFRNIYIDPFDTYEGFSYFGYRPDMTITTVLASKQKPVDEVHKRHFWKRKQKQTTGPIEKLPEKKKFAVLQLLRGGI